MIQRLLNVIRQYKKEVQLFFLVIAALGFAIDGVYTVLMNLYLLRLGYGTEFIGLLNAVGLLTFAISSLPAGILGTRWSNLLMLKLGVGFILVGGGLLPLAEFTPLGWQDPWLVINYALMLCGFSLFFVNGAPFLMDVVDTDKQNSAFAVQTALLSLAAFVGSLVGGIFPEFIVTWLPDLTLADPAPFRMTLMIVTLVISVAFILILTVKQPYEATQLDDIESESLDGSSPPITRWALSTLILIGIMTFVRLFQVAGMATGSGVF